MERWNYSSLNTASIPLLERKKVKPGQFINRATFTLMRKNDLIKLRICSNSQIHIWWEQEEIQNRTSNTALKRKISQNGENQQELDKEMTWSKYTRPFKRARRSVKLPKNGQQLSFDTIEELENSNPFLMRAMSEPIKPVWSSSLEKQELESPDLQQECIRSSTPLVPTTSQEESGGMGMNSKDWSSWMTFMDGSSMTKCSRSVTDTHTECQLKVDSGSSQVSASSSQAIQSQTNGTNLMPTMEEQPCSEESTSTLLHWREEQYLTGQRYGCYNVSDSN